MYCHGTLVVNNTPDAAAADLIPHAPALTKTAGGSPNVFVGD